MASRRSCLLFVPMALSGMPMGCGGGSPSGGDGDGRMSDATTSPGSTSGGTDAGSTGPSASDDLGGNGGTTTTGDGTTSGPGAEPCERDEVCYLPVVDYGVDPGLLSFAAGDVDGDGAIDVAVAGSFGAALLFGDGDSGELAPPEEVIGAPVVGHVALGDPDGDGDLDILMSSAAEASVRFVVVDDTGFSTSVVLPTTGQPVAATFGEFGGAPFADIAALNPEEGIDVFLGQGDLSFEAATTTAPPGATRRMYTGAIWLDLDGDNINDLVTESSNLSTVDIFLGSPSGLMTYSTGISMSHDALAAADLNGDGLVELIAATSRGLSVFPGGLGPIFETSNPQEYDLGSCAGVAAGSFDGDDAIDVAVLSREGNLVIGRNLGGGMLGEFSMYPAPGALKVMVADMNGDGRDDFVLGAPGGASISVYLSGSP